MSEQCTLLVLPNFVHMGEINNMETPALDRLLDDLHGAMKSIQDNGTAVKKDTVIASIMNPDNPNITAGPVLLAMIELRDIKKLNE